MDHFLPSHQNFTQNSARNSKIGVLVKKWQKNCSFQSPKIDFWIQWQYRIFWHVSRIQKSHPIWRRQKVEVDSTPSAPCHFKKKMAFRRPLWIATILSTKKPNSTHFKFHSTEFSVDLAKKSYRIVIRRGLWYHWTVPIAIGLKGFQNLLRVRIN